MSTVPILFLVFNRPDTTIRVFQQIRQQKPKKLFIAADGPRSDKVHEAENCQLVRESIMKNVDWDCEVKTLFREHNLGCRAAVQGALDWFFDHVEEGIILEDDTLPAPIFFDYCATLLQRYRNDSSIFSINGCSLGYNNKNAPYGLTRYFNMWGWATWRRSCVIVRDTWLIYEKSPDILKDPQIMKQLKLPVIWDSINWYKHWQGLFHSTYVNKTDTWDYQWAYTALKREQLCVRPGQNMVINIGFNESATHTKEAHHPLSSLHYGEFEAVFPSLPDKPVIDNLYETEFVAKAWNSYEPFKRSKIGRLISKLSF